MFLSLPLLVPPPVSNLTPSLTILSPRYTVSTHFLQEYPLKHFFSPSLFPHHVNHPLLLICVWTFKTLKPSNARHTRKKCYCRPIITHHYYYCYWQRYCWCFCDKPSKTKLHLEFPLLYQKKIKITSWIQWFTHLFLRRYVLWILDI